MEFSPEAGAVGLEDASGVNGDRTTRQRAA